MKSLYVPTNVSKDIQIEIIAPKEKEKGKIAINSEKTVYHKILKRWLTEQHLRPSIVSFNQTWHVFPGQLLPGTIVSR